MPASPRSSPRSSLADWQLPAINSPILVQVAHGPALSLIIALVVAFLSWSLGRGIRNLLPGARYGAIAHGRPLSGCSLPDPDPLTDFDLATATTRDYLYANKTLRHPYHQTMAHRPMDVNHWIEIDRDYEWYLDEKARVIRDQGRNVLDSLPENDEACGELLMVLADYLPKRYPTLFRCDVRDAILNLVTQERHPDLSRQKGVEALRIVSRLVQDDFLMGRERDNGEIYLVGGLVAFPGSYLLSETINKPLRTLHAPVPHFNEKLLTSVERTLKRFKPDQPFERSSWMIADDRNLFWHNIASVSALDSDMNPKDLYLRIDHQTFRKLPRTNTIIFGVHPILRKIEDLANTPLVPKLLAKVHAESDPALLKYKSAHKYDKILLPYLKELTEGQLERGLITNEDDVRNFRGLLREDRV